MNNQIDEQGLRVKARRKYLSESVNPLILKEIKNPSKETIPAEYFQPTKKPTAQERHEALLKEMNSTEFQMEINSAAERAANAERGTR